MGNIDAFYQGQQQLNGVSTIISFQGNDSETVTNDLIAFAEEQDYLMSAYLSVTTTTLFQNSTYIYASDTFADINTKHGTVLDYTSSNEDYLSTNIDDKAATDIIDFVDKRNNKPYQIILEIRPFSQLRERASKQTQLWVNFYAKCSSEQIMQTM